jgi:hypothetical protein
MRHLFTVKRIELFTVLTNHWKDVREISQNLTESSTNLSRRQFKNRMIVE